MDVFVGFLFGCVFAIIVVIVISSFAEYSDDD